MNEFKNTALVIANGEFPYHKSALAPLKENWKIICIDGAADKLKSLGKEPDIVIGDFDSTKISLSQIKNKIAAVGYDTKEARAEESVYLSLPGCCQYDHSMVMNKVNVEE